MKNRFLSALIAFSLVVGTFWAWSLFNISAENSTWSGDKYVFDLNYASSGNVSGMTGKTSFENIEFNGQIYQNSIITVNNSDLIFSTGGAFNNIKGAVAVDGSAEEDAAAVFKIYVDSTLVYVSDVIGRGEMESFDVDIPNGDTIRFRVCGIGHDYKDFFKYFWLSPVLTYGETVAETDGLSALSIDGKDIVFSPAIKDYTVELEGYETELRLRAGSVKSGASIKVNGIEAESFPFTITELPSDNIIVVSVTYGSSTEEYRIKVVGELGDIFYDNAMNTMDDYKNGESRWLYQRYDTATSSFVDINGSWVYSDKQPYFGMENSSYRWARMGAIFAHPGSGDVKVSRTYVVPLSGDLSVSLWAAKLYETTGSLQSGNVGLSIYKNSEKVWPTDSEHQLLGGDDIVDVSVNMTVETGDRIYFIVDNWDGSNGQDATYMDTTVSYMSQSQADANKYRTLYADVLSLTDKTVTAGDKTRIVEALDSLKSYSIAARRLLMEELRHLEELRTISVFLENDTMIPAGVEKFVTTVKVGVAPELPDSANIYLADGNVISGTVTWDSYDPQLLSAPGRFTISGTVDGYDGGTYFLVIVTDEEGSNENIVSENPASSGLPMAFASYSNLSSGGDGGDYAHWINDGEISKANWTTYNSKNAQDYVGIIFGSGFTVREERVYKLEITMPVITTYATQPPNLLKIQYYTGPDITVLPDTPDNMLGSSHPLDQDENWTDIEEWTQDVPFASESTSTITFDAVDTVAIRLVMSPNPRPIPSSGDGCIGIVELTCIGEFVPGNRTPGIEDIILDGEPLEGFSPDVSDYVYNVKSSAAPDVEVIVSDGSVASVIPSISPNGIVKIIVTAEDGTSTAIYSIQLDNSAYFRLNAEKELTLEEIDILFSKYSEDDCDAETWAEIVSIFEDARADVSSMTDVESLRAYRFDVLEGRADAVITGIDALGTEDYQTGDSAWENKDPSSDESLIPWFRHDAVVDQCDGNTYKELSTDGASSEYTFGYSANYSLYPGSALTGDFVFEFDIATPTQAFDMEVLAEFSCNDGSGVSAAWAPAVLMLTDGAFYAAAGGDKIYDLPVGEWVHVAVSVRIIKAGDKVSGTETNIYINNDLVYSVNDGFAHEDLTNFLSVNRVQLSIPEGTNAPGNSVTDLDNLKLYAASYPMYSYSVPCHLGEHEYTSGGVCHICNALENGKDGFKSASITLTDGVIINYFTLLSETSLSDPDAYVHFTSANGIDVMIPLSEGVADKGRYKFSLELRPDQMADEITAQVVYGDGSTGSSVVYSVREYAEKLDDADAEKLLANAMLRFGAFTQLYTGENTDDLAASVEDYTENAVISDDFSYNIVTGASGIILKGATLQIGAYTTIRVRYELSDGASIDDFTFKCGNDVLEVEQIGGSYYVYLRNIRPQNLDEKYTFTVSDGEGTTTLEYSAFSYMKNVLENAGSYDKALVNLINAMYDYNAAANAYIG